LVSERSGRSRAKAILRRSYLKLKENDLVLWKDPRKCFNSESKLKKAFKGPYQVVRLLNTGVAVLKEPGKRKYIKVPVGQLKRKYNGIVRTPKGTFKEREGVTSTSEDEWKIGQDD
jgi:hypothetical protein